MVAQVPAVNKTANLLLNIRATCSHMGGRGQERNGHKTQGKRGPLEERRDMARATSIFRERDVDRLFKCVGEGAGKEL